MNKPIGPGDFPENIRPAPLADALSERYLAYALSTIMSRSLPDVRDGLKPVQRRILFAMRQLRLSPQTGFKKCARVVGDVVGKYHPHGDQAVYDTLVRLAQLFAQRYPLVDGQGNFGNVDGDNAAAMRYTEARLTAIAELLLEGIDADTVDFQPNYDGEEEEPVVLPAAFPNLLANGSTGIAVGMATSIPPHNALELVDGLLHLVKHPGASVEKLQELIPGPDFPTGGVLVEPAAGIREAYESGRGSFRLRARWEKEEIGRGQFRVIVTEVPYQVAKGRLIERIAELLAERKLPLLGDIRDESAEDVRIVLEPRSRTVDPDVMMESLFRATDLETRISLNLNVLVGGRVPKVLGLREALQEFLNHRLEVLERRSRHRLAKIEERLHILDGLLIAYLNIDELLRIIRFEDEPKAEMMRRFELTETQADAILNMRLRALHKLEELEIKREHEGLSEEASGLRALLDDEDLRWKRISEELRELKKKIAADPVLGPRRTSVAEAPRVSEVPLEAMIEREPITVICSEKGWIRAVKGHVAADTVTSFKEGDRLRFLLHAETTDKLIVFGEQGRAYTIPCDRLPRGRGHGEPLRLIVEMAKEDEALTIFVHREGEKRLVVATDGRGFVAPAEAMVGQTRNGKVVLTPGQGAKTALCIPAAGDTVAVIGDNRKLLVFPLSEVPEMARGRGVILQRYKDGGIADAKVFDRENGLTWSDSSGRTRTEPDLLPWEGARASAGRMAPRGFNRSGRFDG
ncbi:DNA topoisomerase IV subunit A [Marinibaculum pumilum]|uniref:DNA topoisomerase 4 subunit A n=1 Tax=Marinibaculum pumilum TaxID=1766165 RepID=A0ABV7KWA1_9PROT